MTDDEQRRALPQKIMFLDVRFVPVDGINGGRSDHSGGQEAGGSG